MLKKYSKVRSFKEGIAAVKNLSGRWGFIDKNHEEVIVCQFVDVMDFSEGFAAVFDGKACGFINRRGDIIIPCKYSTIYERVDKSDYWWGVKNFREGLAPACIKVYNYKYPFHKKPIPQDRWGYIDANGNEVVECKYSNVGEFKNGKATVSESFDKKGIIDNRGNEITPCKYSLIDDFHDGLALVNIGYHGHSYGYIDMNGVEVIPCQYYDARPFSEGLAVVLGGYPNKEFKILNMTGCTIFMNNKYDDAKIFSEGLLPVCKDKKWGFISKSGLEVIPLKYDRVECFVNGFAKVRLNGIDGVIAKNGRSVFSHNGNEKHLEIDIVEKFGNTYALVCHDEKYGLMDSDGLFIVDPIYDYLGTLNEGILIVSIGGVWETTWDSKRYYKDGKYGLIAINRNKISPCVYKLISEFDGLFFRAERNNNYYLIDVNGFVKKYEKENWLCINKYDFRTLAKFVYALIQENLGFFSQEKIDNILRSYIYDSQEQFEQLCSNLIYQYLSCINIDLCISTYSIYINSGTHIVPGDRPSYAWIELVSITGIETPRIYTKSLLNQVYNYYGDAYLESLLPYYFEQIYFDKHYSVQPDFHIFYTDKLKEELIRKSEMLTEKNRQKAKENYCKTKHHNTLMKQISHYLRKALVKLEHEIIINQEKKGINFERL